MVKSLVKVGKSQGVILDRAVLDLVGIPPDGQVEITTDGSALILRPAKRQGTREAARKMSHTHERALRCLEDS